MRRHVLIVMMKEILDNARDRRSLLIALIYPLLGPLLLGLMISAVDRTTVSGLSKKFPLSVDGTQYGPEVVDWLEQRGVQVHQAPADVHDVVSRGDLDVVIIIAPDFHERFSAQSTAGITVLGNTSTLKSLMNVNKVVSLLRAFNTQVWGQRIAERGIDYKALQPLKIDTREIESKDPIFDVFLLVVPPLFIFNLFMGGAYLSMDTTSGERERGSLEPLLINPVKRGSLVLGKFLAALFYTFIAVTVQLITLKVVFYLNSGTDAYSMPIVSILSILVFTLPLMMAAVAVQFIIATITRSFKEAQTYVGLLPLVPALPAMLLVFSSVKIQIWMMVVPILSQTLLIGQVLRQGSVSLVHVAISMSATMVLVGALLFIVVQMYEREELIFTS